MTIERKLLGTTPVSGEVLPEAVSFDGTNDYLSRSSDMTGNSEGKTFTFSCWVYIPSSTDSTIGLYNAGSFWFKPSSNGGMNFVGYSYPSFSNPAFYANLPAGSIPLNTYSNILISINVTGGVSTRLRYVYINDVDVTSSADWYESEGTGWYNDQLINFTNSTIVVGGNNTTTHTYKGRLAHLFLDYTYRDLSVTANRRLFIDADGKPSKTIPSSPILYLPMTDAATAGSNSGTGGDFTVNGVLATAERGPNQDNCSASVFDGSADYLSRSSITGIADSKVVTFSCFIKDELQDNTRLLYFKLSNGDSMFDLRSRGAVVDGFILLVKGSSGGLVFESNTIPFNKDVNTSFQMVIDTETPANSKFAIDGVVSSISINNSTNAVANFGSASSFNIGSAGSGNYWNGSMGEVYFNTAYTDLATDNPFWDSDTNRPNSVRKVIEDTGVTPLIALPLMGNDAGNNLGTGGDFTVNSGPFVGARGGSEFWARSADFNGTNGYLSRSGNSGLVSSKKMTVIMALKKDNTTNKFIFQFKANGPTYETLFCKDVGGDFGITIQNGDGSAVLSGQTDSSNITTGWHILMFSADTASTSTRDFYLDGSVPSTVNWRTYTNSAANLSAVVTAGIGNDSSGNYYDGDLSHLYIVQDYIDLSQEANRNKFVDQLGYPRDLTQQIEDGDIPNPLIYMKFDDTAALGTNSGTGGNFTVNGTVTAGADVTP